MADDKTGRALAPLPVRSAAPRQRKLYKNARLPVMPLAILLPQLGELSELHRLQPQLEKRLSTLQDASSEDQREDSGRTTSEESMLNQVLQWLSVEVSEE